MRTLTVQEREMLQRRQAGFDDFIKESFPILVDFVARLNLPEPHMVLQNAKDYVAAVDSWLSSQVISSENRMWILTRMGYFLGEVLTQSLQGAWFIDEDPESPYFSQYVVGQFSTIPNRYARIPPFALAAYYVDQPPGRSLIRLIERTKAELAGTPLT